MKMGCLLSFRMTAFNQRVNQYDKNYPRNAAAKIEQRHMDIIMSAMIHGSSFKFGQPWKCKISLYLLN